MVSLSDTIAIAGLAFTAGTSAGGFVGWIAKTRDQRRKAVPIVRWDRETMTIINRLNEDLVVEKIEFDGRVTLGDFSYTVTGTYVPANTRVSPQPVRWQVPASGKFTWPVGAMSDLTWLSLTISSSDSTLRNKRVLIHSKASA